MCAVLCSTWWIPCWTHEWEAGGYSGFLHAWGDMLLDWFVGHCRRRCWMIIIMTMIRFRMVKIWIPQNTFFSWFFIGRAFIMIYYIIKLVLEFQFDLQNPLKQPKMWIFENGKLLFLAKIMTFFGPKVI